MFGDIRVNDGLSILASAARRGCQRPSLHALQIQGATIFILGSILLRSGIRNLHDSLVFWLFAFLIEIQDWRQSA